MPLDRDESAPPSRAAVDTVESQRLRADARRTENWKRWGPYLAERQWGTVREDYSAHGECWDYFSHDQARSRAYRWGEDGLLGICDRQARLCFALALWNERDAILKERLFGLTGPEGNHGEDVKELYYYLDATPTSSYLKALYKYPQGEFPYGRLVEENRRRGKHEPEFEITDTGVFDDGQYFDVIAEYAKDGPEDILIRITIENPSRLEARLHVLPTLWFRNTWSWGRQGEGYGERPMLSASSESAINASHPVLGDMILAFDPAAAPAELLFTENETNTARLFGVASASPYSKDAFHRYVVNSETAAVNPNRTGTKAAAHFVLTLPPGGKQVIRARLVQGTLAPEFGEDFDRIFAQRLQEADQFYAQVLPHNVSYDEANVARQAYAGLLWSKQFYHYVLEHWVEGDPAQPAPPEARKRGRNWEWKHVYCRDVISMPDKWEYPWFAAWDLAFHMVPFARIDPEFAKDQLLLMLREWYMHPNGQMAAYEFALSDVNPPVHAWAVWRVYKMTGERGRRDRLFLARCFQKLLLNFTWWVNRKDSEGNNLFSGGFLGLDNIGVFDRSKPLPTGGHLDQADGTAWMAFYSATMLSMALELAQEDPSYEDLASKFFEHFVAIVDAMNTLGGSGLWNEEDGFYYDHLHVDGRSIPLRTRSMVGALPLIAVEVLEERSIDKLPGFRKRMNWFLENRRDLARHIAYDELSGCSHGHRLLAVPSRERLVRVLGYLLDESEFLSPHGLRSLSRVHKDRPYVLRENGAEYSVEYVPGDSNTGLFGGNSNWRGPVWFPLNYLLVEALERYHHYYGDSLHVECPKGSGRFLTLKQVADELSTRLSSLFLERDGRRPCHGDDPRYVSDSRFRELVLFHEYFHGEDGRGVGASHQTGWTALVVRCLESMARARAARGGM
ncbi:MAG: MGH1-like glycoside hydrolase domain-containing protein [Myxococcota bacterium]